MSIVIAIDGPAGTGKSTVSREVARRLGLEYLDTGATYRVGALYCLREGVDLKNADDVTAMVATMNVEMRLDPNNPHVILDGDDVTPPAAHRHHLFGGVERSPPTWMRARCCATCSGD